MPLVKIITMKGNKITVFAETNEPGFFKDVLQYILDSCSGLEEFMIWDTETNRVYKMLDIAMGQLGMRKRTFEERMNNVKTYVSNEQKGRQE